MSSCSRWGDHQRGRQRRMCYLSCGDFSAMQKTTAMARTSGRIGDAVIETFDRAAFSNSRGTAQYRISKDFSFEFAQPGNEGHRTLDYFIGAGNIGRSYISAVDGFLFQAPVAWYATRRAWDLSPGYELSDEVNLGREVGTGCLECHATGLLPLRNTSNGFAAPPWTESGIGCERCHGEGEAHVRGNRSAIVNPAKLSGTVRDSVCAQCHLPGAVEIVRTAKLKPYAPGENLSDSVSVFVLAGEDREAQRQRSLRTVEPQPLLAGKRRQALVRNLSQGTRHRLSGGPANLLPAAVPDVSRSSAMYGAGRDACGKERRLPRVPHAAQRFRHGVTCRGYRPHDFKSASRRYAGRAGLIVLLNALRGMISTDRGGSRLPRFLFHDNNRSKGCARLRFCSGRMRRTRASESDAGLAQLYDRMKREDEACALYGEVANLDKTAAVALVNFGACLAKEGKAEDAIKLWQGVLETNPSLEAARLNLAVALFRTGRQEQAAKHLREALRFDPASHKASELLSGMQ